MKTGLLTLCAGAAMLLSTGAATAGEPVRLTSVEMDQVSAGYYCNFCFTKKVVSFVYVKIVADVDGVGRPYDYDIDIKTDGSRASSHSTAVAN